MAVRFNGGDGGEAQKQSTLRGIANTKQWFLSQDPEYIERVMGLIETYARTHYRFLGGDVLDWARKHGLGKPPGKKNWRNVWSGPLAVARERGFFIKVGRGVPTTKQSHTSSLARWQSCLIGPLTPEDELDSDHLVLLELRKAFILRQRSLEETINKVFAYGFERGVQEAREKLRQDSRNKE